MISAAMSLVQEIILLEILTKHKREIGSTLADIKGIHLSLCIHNVILEEGQFKFIDQQRRLNPRMKRSLENILLSD